MLETILIKFYFLLMIAFKNIYEGKIKHGANIYYINYISLIFSCQTELLFVTDTKYQFFILYNFNF